MRAEDPYLRAVLADEARELATDITALLTQRLGGFGGRNDGMKRAIAAAAIGTAAQYLDDHQTFRHDGVTGCLSSCCDMWRKSQ